jgi:hypothetical protein
MTMYQQPNPAMEAQIAAKFSVWALYDNVEQNGNNLRRQMEDGLIGILESSTLGHMGFQVFLVMLTLIGTLSRNFLSDSDVTVMLS